MGDVYYSVNNKKIIDRIDRIDRCTDQLTFNKSGIVGLQRDVINLEQYLPKRCN